MRNPTVQVQDYERQSPASKQRGSTGPLKIGGTMNGDSQWTIWSCVTNSRTRGFYCNVHIVQELPFGFCYPLQCNQSPLPFLQSFFWGAGRGKRHPERLNLHRTAGFLGFGWIFVVVHSNTMSQYGANALIASRAMHLLRHHANDSVFLTLIMQIHTQPVLLSVSHEQYSFQFHTFRTH